MKKIKIRTLSQIIIIVIILFLAFAHQKYWIEKAASIHAYCPLGALESILTYIFSWTFITKIYRSNVILFVIFLLLTIFFGRVFCGFFCPLWAISEWIRSLWRKLGIKKDIEIPAKVDKYMRYIKYLVLIAVIYFSFRYTALVFDSYDPFSAFSHLGNEFDELIFAYAILGFIVITALFSKGRRCRYFCPLGAFFALLKKLSFFKLKKDNSTCTSCGLCNRNCPANIKFNWVDQVTHPDCISCMKCVTGCPKGSLEPYIFGKKIKKQTFLWLLVWLFFGILSIIIWTPIRKTKPVSNIISDQGIIEVENIKWSNTLQYVIDSTKIPFDYLQEELQLPENIDKKIKLKEIWTTYNIKNSDWNVLETEDFRNLIDQYLNQK